MPLKMRGRRRILLTTAVAATLLPSFARAAAVPWTNPSGGDYSDPANWNGGAGPVPGAGDTAVFNLAGAYTTTFTNSPTAAALAIASSNLTFVTDGTPRTYQPGNTTISTGELTLGPSAGVLAFNPFGLNIQGGGGLFVNGGNDVTTINGPLIGSTTAAGLGAVATLSVSGLGSSFTANGNTTGIAGNTAASISFTDSATGTFGGIFTANPASSFADASLTVASGADVGITGYFQWGTGTGHANQTYAITVTGAGSTLTQTNGFFTIGGTNSTSTLIVSDGATFSTNHDSMTGYSMQVNGKATIDYTGGTLNVSREINLSGGTMRRTDTTGTLNWPQSSLSGIRRMNITAGGKFEYAGDMALASTAGNSTTVNVGDANSRFAIGGALSIGEQTAFNINAGALLQSASLAVSAANGATITVDGTGASLVAGAATVGGNLLYGTVTFRNNATGTFSGPLTIHAGQHNVFNVQSGADVTAGDIAIASSNSGASTVLVTDAGSTLTQSGAVALTVGTGGNVARLNIWNGAVFNSGTGTISVTSGEINASGGGGTFNANGDISINFGNINGMNWAAGKTLTNFQGQVLTGDLLGLVGNTISVSGFQGMLNARRVALTGGSTATFFNQGRGQFHSFSLGADGTAAALTITGVNSRVTTGNLTNTIGAASGAAATVDVLDGGELLLNVGSTLVLNATGTLNITNATVAARGVSIDGGALNFNSGSMMIGPNLSIVNGGRLAMNDNDLFVDYSGPSPESQIRQWVRDGRELGTGITTDPGAPDKVLAIIDNAEWGETTYKGTPIFTNTIVGAYTFFGDANLDGAVTSDDYVAIDVSLGSGNSWIDGDFDMDGFVTSDDYVAIDVNLGKGSPHPLAFAELKAEMIALHTAMFGPSYVTQLANAETNGFGATLVPEPATAAIFACGLLLQRRRAKPPLAASANAA